MSTAPVAAQIVPEQAPSGRAIELFQSDWVLRDWGLRVHDADRDAELSPAEAAAGALAFKSMADSDRDGRVTPAEFRQARAFLLARY